MPREGTEETVRHLFHDAWNRRLLDQLAVAYAADCQVHTSPGRELSGVRALMRWVIGLLAAIPDGEMSVDHYCDVDETDGRIAAVRWTLRGTHLGHGAFGPTSGRAVVVMGMSHLRFAGEQIVEEWTVFDEIAVLRRIYSPAPASPV